MKILNNISKIVPVLCVLLLSNGTVYAIQPKISAGHKYTNKDFYKDGVFQKDVAKESIIQFILQQGEIYTEKMDSLLWVSDFGLGDYEHVGLASVIWLNDSDYGYFAMTMYLLPGQMIPEHIHRPISIPSIRPAKHESWKVIKGLVYNFSETEGITSKSPEIPSSFGIPICRKYTVLYPGDTQRLAQPESWHFMIAGSDGAIVDEYGVHHDRRGWFSSNPVAHPSK